MECLWCGTKMEIDSDRNLTCPYVCQDECPDCGGVIGECHINNHCSLTEGNN